MKKIYTLSIGLILLTIGLTTSCQSTKPKNEMANKEISNKEKVLAQLNSFNTGDSEVVSYINADKYIQHNLSVADGLEGLGEAMKNAPEGGFKVNVIRAFEDGDYVGTHSEYDLFGPKVGFDVFRFEDGKIVEHWDNLSPITPPNPSGRTQLDGETKVTDLDKTEANKELVSSFYKDVLQGAQPDKITSYINPNKYIQHNSAIGDGLKVLVAARKKSAASGFVMGYGNGGGMGNGKGKGMGGHGQEQSLNIAQLPKEELSEAEKEGLMYMLEEEKLARDVYQKLGEKYNINVFKNIPNSEQRHIDAVRELADKYGLEYQTVSDNNIGIFKNKEIQKLYDELIIKGEKSLVVALEVGATIEDVDIYDLQRFLKDVDNQDIKKVYEYLIMGSENHLRAFNKQLIKNGEEPYKARYITQVEVDKILAGTNSHGNAQQK